MSIFARRRLKQLMSTPAVDEWRYAMQRECQEIIPGLFLGPFQVSQSIYMLKQLGITHIVCIRDTKEVLSVKPYFPERFRYLVLDVRDSEELNLIRLFPEAKQFISDAFGSEGRVLVHCNGDIWLSPAFVVMFVMEHCRLDYEDALKMVQNRRSCVPLNDSLLIQIKEYEAIYRAGHALAAFPKSTREQSIRRKREDDDDGDEVQRGEERKRIYRGFIPEPEQPDVEMTGM